VNKKTGVYICSGCEIGKCIDIDALANIAKNEYNTECCINHSFLCNDEGIGIIKKDIAEKKLDAVVIAACSSRVNTSEFSFENNVIIERVNLREQVVWCHPPNDEDTQMLAEDTLRMGIAKTMSILNPEPFIGENLSSDILVIGGGITGITSAIEAAKAGYKIYLVEKSDKLGGWANNLYKQLPQLYPYQQLENPIISDKISEIEKFNNIDIFTSSEIKEISGQPGMFEILISQNGKDKNFRAGSIVMATGWKPYDATKLTEFGYGRFKNIITNVEMEHLAKENNIIKPSDGKPVNSVLFIQCAGSRDNKHLPYCSNFCCGTSLKQAKYIRDFNAESSVFIIYKDIRTPGHYENFYKEIQNDEQIFLTKGDVVDISEENEELIVTVDNTLFDEQIQIKVDLIVLATGMTPANSEELNLNYRLGKGLPLLKYNFPDSHFICFPYETRRTGIYAAGALREPMDITSSIEDAAGATLKAIQCIEATKRGESVHPRSGDKSYPDLYLERCTDCKRCTEECPFGAYDETEKGTPLPNPNRCRRCGICLGACPERIINFSDFSINSISSMIKAVNIPDEFEEKPRVLVFVCENDAYPAFDMAGFKRLQYSAYVRIIPVRCIGSVNNVWISWFG
jgi:quinone-modifying oxidoreductase subunit QmoB